MVPQAKYAHIPHFCGNDHVMLAAPQTLGRESYRVVLTYSIVHVQETETQEQLSQTYACSILYLWLENKGEREREQGFPTYRNCLFSQMQNEHKELFGR